MSRKRLIHTFPNAVDCFFVVLEKSLVVFIGAVQSVENSSWCRSTGYPPVIHMWATRVQTRVCVHSPRPGERCPPLSTAYSQEIHWFCPPGCVQRWDATGSSSPEPSTGNPHASTACVESRDAECLSTSISPGVIHICGGRRRGLSTAGDNTLWAPVNWCGKRWHETVSSRR